MRKRPMQNNNYGHKKRYDNRSGSGGGHHHSNHNRSGGQRKNWPVSREKYLAQARDAMAAGDRVLAENFLQHADHCWRMMMEEGLHRPRPQTTQGQPADGAAPSMPEEPALPENTNALPAFITTPYGQPQQPQVVPPVQNWEERDAE
jgi:Domain of unknown function (DUF4167)